MMVRKNQLTFVVLSEHISCEDSVIYIDRDIKWWWEKIN